MLLLGLRGMRVIEDIFVYRLERGFRRVLVDMGVSCGEGSSGRRSFE